MRYLEQKIDLQDSLVLRFLTGLARVGQMLGLAPRIDPLSAMVKRIGKEVGPLLSLDDPRGVYYLCLCGIDI